MKRQRGRGRKGGGGGSSGGQHQSNRSLESNGPDVKVRGAAVTIYEKYQQLARDSSPAGDRVKTENYLQHAEHYFRIMRAQEESRRDRDDQRPQNQQGGNPGGQNQGGQNPGGQNQGQPQQHRGQGGRDDGAGDGRQDQREQREPREQRDSRDQRPPRQDRPDRGERQDRPERSERSEPAASGPMDVVTPEEGDITQAAAEKKSRRGRKPRAQSDDAATEPAEDAA